VFNLSAALILYFLQITAFHTTSLIILPYILNSIERVLPLSFAPIQTVVSTFKFKTLILAGEINNFSCFFQS
jgi:hypothetical protein